MATTDASPSGSTAPASPDTAEFTFTDHGPWVVDPTSTRAGPAGIGVLRSTTRRQVPDLTASPADPTTGASRASSPAHLGTAMIGWAVKERRPEGRCARAGLSRRLRVAAEHLGPTYIKLGQIISSGEGLFPAELVDEFKVCRDQVPAESFDSVRRVVEEDFGSPLEEVFSWFVRGTARRGLDRAGARARHLDHRRGGGGQGAAPADPDAGASTTSRSCRGWRRSSSVASRSRRWPTRRRSSSCSPRRSPRSSTSASRPRTCWTSPQSFAELDQRGFVIARPHPELVTRRVLVMERLTDSRSTTSSR